VSRVIPSFFFYYFFFNPIRFQSRINQVPNQPVKPDWISKLHSRDKKNIFYKIRLEKGQVDRYRSNRTFPAFHFTSLTPRISRVTFSRHFPSRTFLFLFIYFGTHKKVKKKLWHSWDDATLKASHLSLSPGTCHPHTCGLIPLSLFSVLTFLHGLASLESWDQGANENEGKVGSAYAHIH
jgi:hypothetical protein